MSRKSFLIIVSVFANLLGVVCIFFPDFFIIRIKLLTLSSSAIAMTRTSGILFISIGVMNFLVRKEGSSSALQAVFIGNLIFQIGILCLEIITYFQGLYLSVFSIIPSVIIHIILAIGFLKYLLKMREQ